MHISVLLSLCLAAILQFDSAYHFTSLINNRIVHCKTIFSSKSNDNVNIKPRIVNELTINHDMIISQITTIIGFTILSRLPAQAKEKYIRPIAYSIEMTNPPCMIPRTKNGENSLISRLSKAKVVTLGYHDNYNDTNLEIELISKILASKSNSFDFFGIIQSDIKPTISTNSLGFNNNLAVGLDFVSNTMEQQKILDDFITSSDKKISIQDSIATLKSNIEIDKRYNFDNFVNLFQFAYENKLRLIPLAVPENILKLVIDKGFESLNTSVKESYIFNPKLFIESVSSKGFPRYADKVIGSEYEEQLLSNYINKDFSFDKFLANRIFTDEGIATSACNFIRSNDIPLVILANYERVRFGYGIQERIKNIYNYTRTDDNQNNEILSVILNPTSQDSISPTVQLNLALAYSKELEYQRPFSDFVWFSQPPQMKLLTKTKNPINREGDKPEGESSVLGVFK